VFQGELGIRKALDKFDELDENGDGTLNAEELKPFSLRFQREFGTASGLHEMDRDGDGCVSRQEFVQWFQNALAQSSTPTTTGRSGGPSASVGVSAMLEEEALKLMSVMVDVEVHTLLQSADDLLLDAHRAKRYVDEEEHIPEKCTRCDKLVKSCLCKRMHAPEQHGMQGKRCRKSSNSSYMGAEEAETMAYPLLPPDLTTAMCVLIPKMMMALTPVHGIATSGERSDAWPVGARANETDHIVAARRIAARLESERHYEANADVKRSLEALKNVFCDYEKGVFARTVSDEYALEGTDPHMLNACLFAQKIASCIAASGSTPSDVHVRRPPPFLFACACTLIDFPSPLPPPPHAPPSVWRRAVQNGWRRGLRSPALRRRVRLRIADARVLRPARCGAQSVPRRQGARSWRWARKLRGLR
jgi:hypothetical protein